MSEYPVATLAQMAAIPAAARARFLREFPALLETAVHILSLQQIVGDEGEVILGEPTWLDDGATNATVNIDFQDSDGRSVAKSTTTFDHAASGMEAPSGGETVEQGSTDD